MTFKALFRAKTICFYDQFVLHYLMCLARFTREIKSLYCKASKVLWLSYGMQWEENSFERLLTLLERAVKLRPLELDRPTLNFHFYSHNLYFHLFFKNRKIKGQHESKSGGFWLVLKYLFQESKKKLKTSSSSWYFSTFSGLQICIN